VTRLVLVGVACVLAALPAGADARPGSAGDDGRPNVLLVMTDDMAASDIKAMPRVRELLSKQGTSFSDAITTFPLCCPSRASLLTGQHAHNHGVSGNFAPEGYYGLTHRDNTLPVWLQKSGYHTALVGKYLNGYGARDPKEIPPGYSEWHGSLDLSAYDYFNFTINENGQLHTWGDPAYANSLLELARAIERQEIDVLGDFVGLLQRLFTAGNFGTAEAKNYTVDVTAKITDDILRRQASAKNPFFVWWAPAAPHREDVNSQRGAQWADPRPAPRHAGAMSRWRLPRAPSFDEADMADKPKLLRAQPRLDAAAVQRLQRNHAGRMASLQAVDEGVAKLVATLKSTGQLDNTVIVFTSDNGWIEGQHRIPGDKFVPYEASIHVPLVVRGPGFAKGRTVGAQVSNVDLTPTFLELARARPGRVMDGLSLVSFARRPAAAPRRALPVEATGKLFAAEGFPQEYDQPYRAVRTARFKYVRWASGEQELYDLEQDPDELANKAGRSENAALLRRMAALAKRLSRCRGRACNPAG
jgi:arylsulfatase A-like enzyme